MTRTLPVALLAAALLGGVLAGSASTAPPPAPVASCSPEPADCSVWHASTVTVTWSAPTCPSVTISNDTSGTPVSCTVSNADGSSSSTVIVRRDATPPSVRAQPARGPDSNGWYNGPISVEFGGTDTLSGINSCTSGSYAGPDSASARITGSCTDFAGNRASGAYDLRYDTTAPTAEAKTDRKPDANGWYNRPVTVSFAGADQGSGVDSCAAPVLYKGPDTDKAAVSGTCRDKAANTSQPAALELRYDTVPPSLGRVRVAIGRQGVVLRWTASKDALTYAVVRQPGLRGKKPSTIYNGRKLTFTDRQLVNGVRYRYTVTAYDVAGNGAAKALQARPTSVATTTARSTPAQNKPARTTPALRRPAAGARVSSPPLLVWSTVPNATYYNVQLYRDGKKILTAWTRKPQLRLEQSWTFDGRKFGLSPGVYRWYVWPGFQRPADNRYGKLVGSRTFVVARP
jgi:hypothetical protein